jgi:hypothetical protein
MPLIRNQMQAPEEEVLQEEQGVTPEAALSQDQASPEAAAAPQQNQASPEEQQAYEQVVLAGVKILYDKKTNGNILKMLQSAEPDEAIAQVATMIIVQLDKQSNGTIPETVILPVAAELVGEVAEMARATGVLQIDEAILGRAMQRTVLMLSEEYGVSQEDMQGLIGQFGQDEIQGMVAQQQQFAPQPGAPPSAQPATPPASPAPPVPQGV